jgi:hypothetical protein
VSWLSTPCKKDAIYIQHYDLTGSMKTLLLNALMTSRKNTWYGYLSDWSLFVVVLQPTSVRAKPTINTYSLILL